MTTEALNMNCKRMADLLGQIIFFKGDPQPGFCRKVKGYYTDKEIVALLNLKRNEGCNPLRIGCE